MASESVLAGEVLSGDEAELIRLMRSLSPKHRDCAVEQLRELAGRASVEGRVDRLCQERTRLLFSRNRVLGCNDGAGPAEVIAASKRGWRRACEMDARFHRSDNQAYWFSKMQKDIDVFSDELDELASVSGNVVPFRRREV